MKVIYTLLVAFITLGAHSQTVTTFLNSNNADVDDAMALDSHGNLYGSSFYGGSVTKIAPDGTVSNFVSGLAWANGLAVDSEDNIYVCEYLNESINKYDNDGNLIIKMPLGSGYPSGLIKAYKSDNMIYTDVGDNSVKELAQDGSITVLYHGGPLNVPVGLAYGPGGDLYIGNYIGREIYRLPYGGSELEYVATVPAVNNIWPYLSFIAYAQGFLYGTVYGEHKVFQIDPRNIDDVEIYSGSIEGDLDGDITEATYSYPSGIISNKSGNTLYISEFSGLGNIRKITNGNGQRSQKTSAFEVHSYPNPASDVLNIMSNPQSDQNLVIDIRLYNITTGQLAIHQETVPMEGTHSISLAGLSNGLYELVISNKDLSQTETIVIINR